MFQKFRLHSIRIFHGFYHDACTCSQHFSVKYNVKNNCIVNLKKLTLQSGSGVCLEQGTGFLKVETSVFSLANEYQDFSLQHAGSVKWKNRSGAGVDWNLQSNIKASLFRKKIHKKVIATFYLTFQNCEIISCNWDFINRNCKFISYNGFIAKLAIARKT